MASEDFQRFGWLSKVHRLGDLRDLDETWHGEVPAVTDQVDDIRELGEVVSLRGSQRVSLEERNDDVTQISKPRDVVTAKILAMVVVPSVGVHLPATEEVDHRVEHITTRLALDDGERGLHLPSEVHRTVAKDRAAEAALSIDKTHQPCGGEESFLLVFRTPCIFTGVHVATVLPWCDIDPE